MKNIFSFLTALITFFSAVFVFAASADTNIYLQQEVLSSETLELSIRIDNPSGQAISSVQSWLEYDTNILKGVSIQTDQSAFDFVAPGENNFDVENGRIKIGRSSIQGPIHDTEIFVAKVVFERLSLENTEVKFYDFKVDTSGHTSVRTFEEGFPVNILKKKPENFVINTKVESSLKDSLMNTENQDMKEEDSQVISFLKKRPQNLRISSGPEYVVLAWDELEGAKAYNLYYSNTSGRYLQRRSVGNVQEYYLEGLKTGEEYYFAITAYDATQKETDYSDEVRIRVGYPESSSSPLLFTKSELIRNKTTKHVNTGPAEILLFTVLFAGFITVFLVRKKNIC